MQSSRCLLFHLVKTFLEAEEWLPVSSALSKPVHKFHCSIANAELMRVIYELVSPYTLEYKVGEGQSLYPVYVFLMSFRLL